MAKKILVVDDDPHIRDVVKFALDKGGYVPFEAKNGKEAITAVTRHGPDLMVLDINMPEMDGIEVCKLIRKSSDLPILFLSSRDDEIDRILGLEIGGDDYVTKPFSPRELVARINVILRRSVASAAEQDTIAEPMTHGLLTVDPERHLAAWNGQDVELTATTFHILQTLIEHPERVFNRNSIMDQAYEANIHVSDRTIDSHIRHIRHKFAEAGCQSIIQTVHGIGYKLGPCK